MNKLNTNCILHCYNSTHCGTDKFTYDATVHGPVFGLDISTLLLKISHSLQYPLEGYKKQETEECILKS